MAAISSSPSWSAATANCPISGMADTPSIWRHVNGKPRSRLAGLLTPPKAWHATLPITAVESNETRQKIRVKRVKGHGVDVASTSPERRESGIRALSAGAVAAGPGLSPGGEGGQELVADVGGRDAGDLGVVVGGRDLHDVGADQVQPGEGAQRGQQFPAGQAAGLRGAGAGGVGRVEHVDVDRDVHRPAA